MSDKHMDSCFDMSLREDSTANAYWGVEYSCRVPDTRAMNSRTGCWMERMECNG